MTYQQVHFFEKIEFQFTAIAGAAVVYWFVWPLLIPGDPEWPICFVACGAYTHMWMLAGLACVLGLACGVGTITARPQTAAMALALGLGGLSLRSPRIRPLLWASQDSMPAMYWRMALEVLVLLAMVIIAAAMAGIGRRMTAWLAGGLIWQDPLAALDNEQQQARSRRQAEPDDGKSSPRSTSTILTLLGWPFGITSSPGEKSKTSPGRDTTVRGVLGFMISVTASAIVVFLLLRSPERGQIIFALFAGCFLGVFISQRIVPTRANVTAWATPVVLGVLLYVLEAISSVSTGRGTWMDVPSYARILPIDWMTAGLGGAMFGHWEDLRMREARRIEESLEESRTNNGE